MTREAFETAIAVVMAFGGSTNAVLHGDCLTVTGRTVAENLVDIAPPAPDGHGAADDGRTDPRTGGITILRGSLAPSGTARVFDRERAAMGRRQP